MAYKPAGKQFAIVFEERQIQSIEANLNVNLSSLVLNNNGPVPGIYALDSNTCKVVLQDPYLDGVAWATLDESNDLLGRVGTQGVLEGNLLPKCKPTESPETHRCNRYAVIDASITGIKPDPNGLIENDKTKPGLAYPLVIITLWYRLNGINQTVEQTFYYRVTATNITHGASGEPTVSINGKGAYHLSFQQNLQPVFFQKGKTLVEELNNNESINIKTEGYKVEDVCSTPADTVKIDRNYRINNLTTEELLSKFVNSFEEGGQILSLPTKEFANKIQLCSKQDSSCYFQRVFYLGKGLYESYTIDNQFPEGLIDRNYRRGEAAEGGSADQLASAERFNLFVPDPKATQEKLKTVSPEAFTKFEKQFEELDNYVTGDSSNMWKGEISMNSEDAGVLTVEKKEKIALFGDSGNPVAYLGGKVLRASQDSLVIESPFYMHYCVNNGAVCGRSSIYQEYRKLKSVTVKQDDQLGINNKGIGEANTEGQDKTKFRYYIQVGRDRNIKTITLDPTQIKTAISTQNSLTDQDKKASAPTDGGEEALSDKIGEMGSTGNSSGPHAHVEWKDKRTITAEQAKKYIKFSEGVVIPEGGLYNDRGGAHRGVDLASADGKEGMPLYVQNGAKIINADRGVEDPDGFGYSVEISTPEGNMIVAHLKAGSIPADVPPYSPGKDGAVEKPGDRTGEAKTSGPGNKSIPKTGIVIRTEFKGVPKALSILPGRTILSFVTDYDAWIRNGKKSAIEPGVWIPEKYKNWPITKTVYKWEQGDLRLQVEGRRHFRIEAQEPIDTAIPKFLDYIVEKGYNNYYDYIRSSGDLCFGDSCTKCGGYEGATESSGGQSGPTSKASAYPKGKYTYTCSGQSYSQAAQGLLNAGNQLGITSAAGLAAIIGNGLHESGLNPKQVSGVPGEDSTGLFQWNPSPAAGNRFGDLQKYASDNGLNPLDLNTQLQFFVYEVKNKPGPWSNGALVNALNNAKDVKEATVSFDRLYTISADKPGSPQEQNRIRYAEAALNCMKLS